MMYLDTSCELLDPTGVRTIPRFSMPIQSRGNANASVMTAPALTISIAFAGSRYLSRSSPAMLMCRVRPSGQEAVVQIPAVVQDNHRLCCRAHDFLSERIQFDAPRSIALSSAGIGNTLKCPIHGVVTSVPTLA